MIELDYETQDKIVILNLKNDYELVQRNINYLNTQIVKGTANLNVYTDLAEEHKLLNALSSVLRSRMKKNDYFKFMKETANDYGSI